MGRCETLRSTYDRAAWLAMCLVAGSVGWSAPVAASPVGGARSAITQGWDEDGYGAVVALRRAGAITCSGTLIGPSAVLTAGHCVDLLPPSSVSFGPDPARPVEQVPVTSVVIHPDFERENLLHDIALVLLAYDVDVTPAALPQRDLGEERIGSRARVLGFGVAGVGSTELLRRRAGFSRIAALDLGHFRIVGDPSQPCLGDSGGPTLMRIGEREVVIGVHSGGPAGCAEGSQETRVDAHLDFLRSHRLAGAKPASGGCAVAGPERNEWMWPIGLVLPLLGWRGRRVSGERTTTRRTR